MLGIILNTVRAWVLAHYNQKKWDEILASSGHSGVDFTTHVAYDEKTLYDLVTACVKLLNMPVNEVVEAVGYHFVIFIKGTPYAKMLAIAGSRFSDLLKNLNALHGHMVASHFKNMKSPTFRVVQESETRAFFYYTPGAKERVGLGPLVTGLVRAVAELQFGIMNLTMNQGKTQDDGTIEFLLEWEDDSEDTSDDTVDLQKYEYGLNPSAFAAAFPFHIIVDVSMRVVQVGPSVQKIVPPLTAGVKLSDVFSALQPADLDLKSMKRVRSACEGNVVSLVYMPPIDSTGQVKDPIQLRGQFLYSRAKKFLYFLGSPDVTSIEVATRMGLSLTDFAVHDPTKDILFMTDAKDMAALDDPRRKRALARKGMKKKDSKNLPSFVASTNSSPALTISTPTTPTNAPKLRLDLNEVRFAPDSQIQPSMVENNVAIDTLIRRILTHRLGLDLNVYENLLSECLHVMKSNLIVSLNHLLKLPSVSFLERLKLPLLVETELIRLYQSPEATLSVLGLSNLNGPSAPTSSRSNKESKPMARSTSHPRLNSGSWSLDDSDSPRMRSWTMTASQDRSALLGLTDDMRQALKTSWAEISQPKNGNPSQLNTFFEYLSKELSTMDPSAASVFEGQSFQNQSDSLMGLMGFLTRTIDDPIRAMSTLRQPAVRYLILGFDRQKFQSLAAAIASAINKTLGSVNPNLSETWFTFSKSIFDLFLGEYDVLKSGIAGKLYKMNGGQKWKLFYTLLTHERLIFYRDPGMTDKKDDLLLSTLDSVDTFQTEVAGHPTPFVFYVETASSAKTFMAAETEGALTQWTTDLTRRIRAWSFVASRKSK